MADYKELLGSLVNKAKSVMDNSGVSEVYQKGADRAKAYSRIARLTLDANNQADELRKVFTEIGKLIQGAKKYFLQNFTDRDTVPFGGFSPASKEEIAEFAWEAGRFVESVEIRGVD